MLQVEVSIEVLGDITSQIDRAIHGLKSFPGTASMEVGDVYGSMIVDLFIQRDHGTWEPLAERTIRDRIRLGYGGKHPILKRTGELLSSLTEPDVLDFTKTGRASSDMRYGTRDFRFLPLHFGADAIPPRDMLPEAQTLRKRVEQTCLKILEGYDL